MNEKLHLMQQKQSPEDWQEGVRWEIRVRKIEDDLLELKRKVYWFYVALIAVGVLMIASFLHH